ncbi:MAG: sugar ABC transporter substrate-binding protein [Cellvibrionaceae bacterium]|nr:sugar ABC transporter substrate-binding protein [Cellvibrionaceae bacterium]
MKFINRGLKTAAAVTMLAASVGVSAQTTVTIGTVNNGDMVRMQSLSGEFEKANPDIKLEWVVLEENVLRQRLTTDIAANSGQFDVMTIGMYEAPIWGGNGWLEPMTNLPASYDVDDIFDSVKGGLSHDGTLYALPFYAESSMTMYRKDLFEKAGMKMPANPTWDFMYEAASKIHDPANEVYGACLRGKAGWGENMAFLTTVANSFGARWFDMAWEPQFDTKEWKDALTFYVDLLTKYGPPGVSSNGFNENLALMNSGKCGFWVDATVAGSFVTGKESAVADKMDFAPAPYQATQKGSGWLWAWALAVPVSSDAKDAARKFVTWATSKEYSAIVAAKEGIANIPPGTRKSTYANPEYMAKASFAAMTLEQMSKADPTDSTLKETPYTGVQFVAIPKFQAFATTVGQQFSGALAGKTKIDKALKTAQKVVRREMVRDGYIK